AIAVEARAVLAALPDPVLVVEGGCLRYANAAAEEFFDAGASTLLGLPLAQFLPADSPVFALIESVRRTGASVSEYGVGVDMPRTGPRLMTVQAAPLGEEHDHVVLVLQGRSIADKIDRQLTHRNAARSSIAWTCSPTGGLWSAPPSTSTRCSSACAEPRSRVSRATSASSRITIPRCRRCTAIAIC